MDNFKEIAIETFKNNVKSKMPDIKEADLEIMELAFKSGFNVGVAQDKGKIIQEMALTLLSI